MSETDPPPAASGGATGGGEASAGQRRFCTLRPGLLPYRRALALQERLLEGRHRADRDTLVLLQHPPVITLGRRAAAEHLLLSPAALSRRGIEKVKVGRGGDVTFHGPGQLVGYPIVDLASLGNDLHLFLRLLEDLLIDTLAAFAVRGDRRQGKTGVWVDGAKIASIGVGVRRWVSWHGFALNVGSDLSGFDAIVPCGLAGVKMTSLEGLLGQPVPMAQVEEQVIRSFAKTFDSQYTGNYDG